MNIIDSTRMTLSFRIPYQLLGTDPSVRQNDDRIQFVTVDHEAETALNTGLTESLTELWPSIGEFCVKGRPKWKQ